MAKTLTQKKNMFPAMLVYQAMYIMPKSLPYYTVLYTVNPAVEIVRGILI
jgi:hypothetical protein